MADSERIQLTLPELVREYPLLEEWFADPFSSTAQFHEGKRLMSAREKLELLGGQEQVRHNLATVVRKWRDPYVILLACRQEAMVGYEISKFGELVGKRLGVANLYVSIDSLMDEGELSSIQGLTYVVRMGYDPNKFSLFQRPGYLTTEQGLRQVALNLERKESKELLGGLVPAPNT